MSQYLLTHVFLRRVDHTLSVETMVVILLVVVCHSTQEVRQIVGRNVQLMLNVPVTTPV